MATFLQPFRAFTLKTWVAGKARFGFNNHEILPDHMRFLLPQIFHRSVPGVLAILVFLAATPAFSVKENILESIKEEASREREQEASEDPLAHQQSQKADNSSLRMILPDALEFYGSRRYRYRETAIDTCRGRK
jgi:hypothetical protein